VKGLDGGYLGWVYGSAPLRMMAWGDVYLQYWKETLVLDDSRCWREVTFGNYKVRRKNKRRDDPEKARRRAMVKRFQQKILSPGFDDDHKLCIPYMEADDILALLYVHKQIDCIVGVDKDYLQIPGIALQGIGSDPVKTIRTASVGRRFPKAIQPIDTPMHLLLTLVLMGDRSDSVPRLLPARRFDLYWEVVEAKRFCYKGYLLFGPKFMRNLVLILLPPPVLLKKKLKKMSHLFRMVEDGSYWNPSNFMTIEEVISDVKGRGSTDSHRVRGAVRMWKDYFSRRIKR